MSTTPEQALAWLLEAACPLWLEHGVDWKGGAFEEDLDPATLRPRSEFRRLRVAARQIYVFANAARLGVPRARDAVALGLDFLHRHGALAEGGFAMRFDRAHNPLGRTRDLYDHAFVLLAYAHAGERGLASAHLATIDQLFRHPVRGWHEARPLALPRRQNPHMHLLEALLAAGERFGDAIYLDQADEIVGLFLDHFYQPDVGGLPEYYDDHLVPLREAGCFVLEPGHHHEWVWLLDEYLRIFAATGRPARSVEPAMSGLSAFAEAHGVGSHGIVAAELWSDGRVKLASTRVWQHTERLKSLSRRGTEGQRDAALNTLFRFFEGVPRGLWRERWDGDFIAGDASPASTLYHIACAVLEVQPGMPR